MLAIDLVIDANHCAFYLVGECLRSVDVSVCLFDCELPFMND